MIEVWSMLLQSQICWRIWHPRIMGVNTGLCYIHIWLFPVSQLKHPGVPVALRPRRPGSVFTPKLAICSKCGGKKTISGAFRGEIFIYLLLAAITSTAITQIWGSYFFPKLVKISILGVKILWKFNFGVFHPTFLGLMLPLLLNMYLLQNIQWNALQK